MRTVGNPLLLGVDVGVKAAAVRLCLPGNIQRRRDGLILRVPRVNHFRDVAADRLLAMAVL